MQLAIIVPYRDRAEHLSRFLPHYRKLLPDAEIIIVEQEEGKPFNRGKLLNIGFLESTADYFAFQDVDMLVIRADYSCPKTIRQIASSHIQRVNYFGGVTLFSREAFLKADGYSNEFFCRAEDNELFRQVTQSGIPIEYKFGKFAVLPHKRNGPEFDPVLWERSQQPRINDGLKFCKYKVLKVEALVGGKKIFVSI